MNNVFVGEDIILPRSLRSQNALPYAIKTKNLYQTCRDRRQLVAGTHGPYKFDIIFMFRQQTKVRSLPILHFALCIFIILHLKRNFNKNCKSLLNKFIYILAKKRALWYNYNG